MRLLEDGIVAALAAIGLLSILFLLLPPLLRPRCRCDCGAVAVLPCAGCGAELEHTVRCLRAFGCEYGRFRRVLLLDCGLDDEGKALAAILCREDRSVRLCRRETLGAALEEEIG